MLVMQHQVAVEWPEPASKVDAAQAVLYRVGEAVDLIPDGAGSSPALQGMLEVRHIPALREKPERRRWVGAVCIEEPADRDLPLAARPAFLRFLRLASKMAGGGAVDDIQILGSPLDQAVAVACLLRTSRGRGSRLRPRCEADQVGAFFVGQMDLVAMSRLRSDLRRHVKEEQLVATVRAVDAAAQALALADITDYHWSVDGPLESAQGISLDFETARSLARDLRRHGAHIDTATAALNLGGYLNEAGHRSWYRSVTAQAGGWDA